MGADPLQTDFTVPKRWVNSARAYGYALAFFIIFALAAGQMGMVAKLFQKYGNDIEKYPGHEIKYTLGLILFNSLWTMVIALGSFWAPAFLFVFVLFSASVMWIVPAGILNSVEPYSAGNCGSTFQAPFDRFTADCQIYVGLEALSWTLWAVTLIVFVTLILDFFVYKKKAHTVYGE